MPNLKQLLKLREKFGDSENKVSEEEIKSLLESFDPRNITKAFSFNPSTEYEQYFKFRKKVDVALLFIDATSFSERFNNKTSKEIASFLDEYYAKVVPTIYSHGGEVEKIMGDGIICVFGEPFIDATKEELHRKAEACSLELIANLKGTIYQSKIAFHYGEIMYYKNPTNEYYDFTMVGSSLTELFRLESVSEGNKINFFCDTLYEDMNIEDVRTQKGFLYACILSDPISIDLKGVNYTHIRTLEVK